MDPAPALRPPGPESDRHYALVARAIDFIRTHPGQQPALAQVAAAAGLSEGHLQRVFAEWAGISPKRFVQALSRARARQALRESADVLEAALAAGLSGPGRLHDLMVSCEAMTPGEIRAQGAGLRIGHGFATTPFGRALLAWTPRGLCHFEFCDGDEAARHAGLQALWPAATFSEDAPAAAALAARIFPRVPGHDRTSRSAAGARVPGGAAR